MITKYDKYIKESLSTKADIKNWLDKMEIKRYTINDDLTVDVDGNVIIDYKNLTEIPIKFNKIYGSFYCNGNRLTSLKGCPNIVVGNFICYYNNLTNLEYCPTTIGEDFSCHHNDITSLKGCPIVINNFNCSYNKLTSLEGCPDIVNGNFICYGNPYLVDINDLDSKILIKNIHEIIVSNDVLNKYFEFWIDKDINILSVLKVVVSDRIKQKYSHLFQANNFDLI